MKMTESVVIFLVERIGDFLEKDIRLLSGLREEVEFVRDELERVTAFLRKADMMEERNPQVQVLVKQFRDVAFDMEDILDEFEHHLVQDQRKCFFLKATGSITKLNHHHQIASQIRQIKTRIIAISNGHLRYKDVLDHKSESNIIMRTVLCERRGDAVLLEEDELVGIDNPKSQLLNWLLDEPAFKVISVVGMGGLGKTTLVKNVYNDDAANRHFKSRAWITVSKSFEIEQLLKDLIVQLFRAAMQPIPQGFETMKSHGLKEILKMFIQEGRSLIVLDDVWDIEAWDAIKYAFPRSKNGNRLMLTTRNKEVANASCAEFKGETYCLKPLSFEMSWELFRKKTFQEEQECPPYLVSIAQTILERCKGLPLAIVAISGVLASKKQGNANEWDRVNRNLGFMLQENKLQSVSSILMLSYYDLPFYLQSCLLCMSLLPEDYEIAGYRLLGLWIAEGFVEHKEGMTKHEVAGNYLMELKARSLIQVAPKFSRGRPEVCSIHDLLREVLLSKSKDHKFAIIVNEKHTGWHERIRRLSIHKTLGEIQDKRQISRLRSLLVFGALDFPIKSFGSSLKMIRVLDLEGNKNLDVLPKEITGLYYLRFLNLNYTNVREIPSSIGKLRNLETLMLEGTYVSSLPTTIVNLQGLLHLSVHRTNETSNVECTIPPVYGFKGISGIGRLKFLTILLYMEVNGENGTIEEIGKLKQVRLLGIVNLKREDGAALCSSIEKLTNLRELALLSVNFLDLQYLSVPPQFLQRLCLRGRLEKVPRWITCLHNLTCFILVDSRLQEAEHLLKPIQGLHNLERLYLRRVFRGNKLCFKASGFQKLKELWVSCSETLRHVEVEKSGLPNLQRLGFSDCPSLENLPLGIEDLGKLKYLQFKDVSDCLINRIDKAKGGKDFVRLQHVPEVRVSYSIGGTRYSYILSTN